MSPISETQQVSTAVSNSAEVQGPLPMTIDGDMTTGGEYPPTQVREAEPFPGWRKLSMIMLSLYLCMFLVALDRTILSTAIPTITNDFHSIQDVGWYASAYLLTSCATQLIFGKIYKLYVCKWVLLTAMGIFEVGETVCGSAPNSTAFILGRAIAGLGSAGIFNGAILIMTANVPLHKRPIFMGLFGGVFAIANVCGPLLGGAFTTKLSWRWCFYINLPIGALVVSVLLISIDGPRCTNTDSLPQQLKRFDWLGTFVFLPGIVCLLLALQWGGNTYSWANVRIITLFTLGGILLVLFIIIQFQAGDNATVPIRIIKQRSIAAGVWFSFFNPGAMFILIYYLPIWFQAIKGLDAINSGLHTLPLVLALVVGNLIAGISTRITGYYAPMLALSSLVSPIAAGLFTTLKVESGLPAWLGWQVLFGFGIGLGMQQANLAAQTCLSREDISTGMALMFFSQGFGGVVFVTVAQVVFSHFLVIHLSYLDIPFLTPDAILHTGATELRNLVPKKYLLDVLDAYNMAIVATFVVAASAASFASISAVGIEYINIHNTVSEGRNRGIEHGSGSGEIEGEVTGGVSTLVAIREVRTTGDKGPGVMEQPMLETIKEEREKGSRDSSNVSAVLAMEEREKEKELNTVEVGDAKGKAVEKEVEMEMKKQSDG